MTSAITPTNVDGAYPIAGQDNDSQGFRDNFTNIKNNFTFAAGEITDLQSKSILSAALNGGSLDNDGGGALLHDFEFKDFSETIVPKGSVTGVVTFDYTGGGYQTVTSSGSLTLAFTNFSASGKLSRIRVEIDVTSIAHTVTLPAAVTEGVDTIEGYASNIITFDAIGIYIFEFTTHDAGSVITINDLSRSRVQTTADAIAAAGGTQGTATALTAGVNRVTTIVVTTADGVKLPLATDGEIIAVINGHATVALAIWPGTGDNIDSAAADAEDATPLPAESARRYIAMGTTWYTL